MTRKTTWIIPGLLVTLLAGLMWALPILAAPSSADRGSAEFRAVTSSDGRGGSISHASPYAHPYEINADGDTTDYARVWVEVEDQDLDVPHKAIGLKMSDIDDTSGSEDPATDEIAAGGLLENCGACQDAHLLTTGEIPANETRFYSVPNLQYAVDSGLGSLTGADATAFFGTAKSNARSGVDHDSSKEGDQDYGTRFSGGSTDGLVNSGDVRVTFVDGNLLDSAYTVLVDIANGRVGIGHTSLIGNNSGFKVLFWHSAANTVGTQFTADDDDATPAQKRSEVILKSNADSTGIGVTLTETGRTTGVFGLAVNICDEAESGCRTSPTSSPDGTEVPIIAVNGSGDTLRVEYKDASPSGTRSDTVTIESAAPAFDGFTPGHNAAGTEDDPDFTVEVRDGESKILDDDDDDDSMSFIFALYDTDGGYIDGPFEVTRGDFENEDSITNGFEVTASFRSGSGDSDDLDPMDNDEYEIHWWVRAVDQAGNIGLSDQKGQETIAGRMKITNDSDEVEGTSNTDFTADLSVGDTLTIAGQTRIVETITDEETLTVDRKFTLTRSSQTATKGVCVPFQSDLRLPITNASATEDDMDALAGCDPYVVRVDEEDPRLVSATAGPWLDGKTIKEGPDAIRTSVMAMFSENMDCASFSTSDFEVDNDEPSAVTCHADHKNRVFLTVSEMDPDDTPRVEVVDTVTDLAGNELDDDVETASDGMPAILTVTVTGTAMPGSRPVTDETVTVTIESDERLGSRPNVEVNQVYEDYCLVSSGDDAADTDPCKTSTGANKASGTGRPTGTANEWEFEVELTTAGLYNVYVTGTDQGGSIDSVKGVAPADFDNESIADDNPILIEVDTGIPTPTFTPEDKGETDDPNVFLKIAFTNEGKEYGLDADDGVEDFPKRDHTTVSGNIVTDFDTSSTVTLTKATLDGPGYDTTDVMENFSSRDNVLHIWRPGSLELGSYTLKVTGRDAAGNTQSWTSTFKVTERKPYKVHIDPGSNLVSIPANPASGDVNDVFGAETAISLVMTYDNPTGLWQVARRGSDGQFTGNLETIDSRHAYWVVSDDQLDLEILLPASSELTVLPPAIEVYKGWNLVPVVDVQQRAVGATVPANDYFANIDWDVAYGYDTVAGIFAKVTKTAGTTDDPSRMLEVGQGYFVYANEDGVIIP